MYKKYNEFYFKRTTFFYKIAIITSIFIYYSFKSKEITNLVLITNYTNIDYRYFEYVYYTVEK